MGIPSNDLNISQSGFVTFNGVSTFNGRTLIAGAGVSITNANGVAGNPTISLAGGGAAVEHLTGNTGGQLNPDGSNNFNLLTANSTVKIAGSGSTLTQDFGITNLILGSAAASITSGNTNVGIGQLSLNALTSGAGNSFGGVNSGGALTSGNNNTGWGIRALSLLTSGSGNVGMGTNALQNLLTGQNNVVIGEGSGTNLVAAETANIYIGPSINSGSESNTIRIGTTGSGITQQNKCFVAAITGITAVGSPVAVSSTGQLSDLGFGTATQVLTSNGAGVSPTWQAAGGGSSFNGFLAFLSGNVTNVTGDGTNYTIAFNSTSYNTGTNFNTGTFTYTAPTTGKYIFGGVVYGFGYGAGHTQQNVNLITTATSFTLYTVNPFLMAGNGTLVVPFSQECQMTAGDTAVLNLFVNNSTKTIGVGGLLGLSSFWGQFLG